MKTQEKDWVSASPTLSRQAGDTRSMGELIPVLCLMSRSLESLSSFSNNESLEAVFGQGLGG